MADIDAHRIVHLTLPQSVQPAAWALCRHSKDIYNTIIELISQAQSACEWGAALQAYKRKPAHCLSPREAAALDVWDAQIAIENAKWSASHLVKKAAWDARQAENAKAALAAQPSAEPAIDAESNIDAGRPAVATVALDALAAPVSLKTTAKKSVKKPAAKAKDRKHKTHKKEKKAVDSDAEPKDLTLPVLGETIAQGDLWKILLNSSLLLAAAKNAPDAMISQSAGKAAVAFRSLPAKMAEASVFLAQKSFKDWLANVAAWRIESQGRGMPKPPKHLPRCAALVCSTSGAAVGENLSSLKKCLLWLDPDHFKPLSKTDRDAYAAFPIRDVAEKAIAARWANGKKPQGMKMPAWEDLAKVVLIPQKDGTVALRISVKVEIDYPANSFLATVAQHFPKEWTAADTPALREKMIEGLVKAQNWLPSGLPDAPFAKNPFWVGDRFCACGMDLGLRNIVTMAWTHGEDADVFDARALDQTLDQFDRAADKWISGHMTDEHKRLEREKLDWAKTESTKPENLRDKFPLKKANRLRQVSETLHNRKAIARMRAKRARWLRDKLHQISAKVVKLAVQRGAAVVVIGQNKGWKEGIDLGKRENRRFIRLAHAELIKLIGQKLAVAGVAMILTEESHTSEASFVDHDPLREARPLPPEPDVRSRAGWGASVAEALAAKNEMEEKKEANARAAIAAGAVAERHGSRDTKNRDRFVRQTPWVSRGKGQTEKPLTGPAVLHADVNGAFNILRKACPLFKWHPGLSVRAAVWQMSWRDGLSKRKMNKAAKI